MRVKSKFLSYLLTGAMVVSMIPAVGAKEAKADYPTVDIMIVDETNSIYQQGKTTALQIGDGFWVPGVSADVQKSEMGWGDGNIYVTEYTENISSRTYNYDSSAGNYCGYGQIIIYGGGEATIISIENYMTKIKGWLENSAPEIMIVVKADENDSSKLTAEVIGPTDENPPSDSTGTGTTDENPPSDSTGTGTTDTNTPSDSTGSGDTGADDSSNATPTVTLHFKNSEKWNEVAIYFTATSDWVVKTAGFPGDIVKKEVGSDVWYEYDYYGSEETFNFIFNNNKEEIDGKPVEIKTDDIKNVKPGQYWITLKDAISTNEETGNKMFAYEISDKAPSDYDGQGLPALDWNEEAVKISTEYMDKGSKETAVIDMGTETVVDKLVTGTIKGQDVNVEFKLANGLAWKVNGKDVTTTGDLNLGATLNTKNIPEDTVAALKTDNDFANTTTLTLDHNGDFGAKLQLLFPAGKDKAGKKFQLFYYNPTTKALEKQGDAVEADENGNVPFTFTHASDYVIAEEKTAAAPAATVAPGKKADVIVHVNFGANEAWSAINAYSWTKGGDVKFLGEWPGSAMSKNEKNAGWYSIAFDVNGADEVNIIFNDGNGTQTVDLKLSAATGEFWYTLGEKDADGKFAATESTTKPEGWVDSDVASSNGTGTTGTSSPKTGDNSKAPIAAAVMVLAIAGGVIAYRKREMFI